MLFLPWPNDSFRGLSAPAAARPRAAQDAAAAKIDAIIKHETMQKTRNAAKAAQFVADAGVAPVLASGPRTGILIRYTHLIATCIGPHRQRTVHRRRLYSCRRSKPHQPDFLPRSFLHLLSRALLSAETRVESRAHAEVGCAARH